MKRLLKASILFTSLSLLIQGCQKDDPELRKVIQGEWGKQLVDKVNGDVGYQKLVFYENGFYKFFARVGDTIDECYQIREKDLDRDSLKYSIQDGKLFKQDPFEVEMKMIEYRIIRMTDSKLNIIVDDRKQNQTISDRLQEQEIFDRCK